MYIQQFLYQRFGGFFDSDGRDPSRTAFDTVAVGSVVFGLIYSLIAAAILSSPT